MWGDVEDYKTPRRGWVAWLLALAFTVVLLGGVAGLIAFVVWLPKVALFGGLIAILVFMVVAIIRYTVFD